MSNLPQYIFTRIKEMETVQQKKGVDVIDIGERDSDLPTPPHIVKSLCQAVKIIFGNCSATGQNWHRKGFSDVLDSGLFNVVQHAAITTLSGSQDCVKDSCTIHQKYQGTLITGLRCQGVHTQGNLRYRGHDDCRVLSVKSLNKTGIVATPGIGFGACGESYVRFVINCTVTRFNEAIERMLRLDL